MARLRYSVTCKILIPSWKESIQTSYKKANAYTESNTLSLPYYGHSRRDNSVFIEECCGCNSEYRGRVAQTF